jgi:serine phosphatase RsbU (regulator of sigma subunit)
MVAITLSALLMAISLSCQNETKKRSERVSLNEAFLLSGKHQARYDLVSDSLYEVGAISSVMRDFLHGYYVMYGEENYDRADTIFKKIIDLSDADKYDRLVQIAAIRERLLILRNRGYYETATILALDALKRFSIDEADDDDTVYDLYLDLYFNVGLGMTMHGEEENGETYYEKCYELNISKQKDTGDKSFALMRRMILLYQIIQAHNTDSHRGLEMMKRWIDRQEKTFAEYETLPDEKRNDVSLDQLKGHAYIDKARVLQGLGRDAEAVEAYQKYLATNWAKTTSGVVNSCYYLGAAKRWEEASRSLEKIDEVLMAFGTEMSLDIMKDIYLQKYKYNLMAGHRDTANVLANRICQNLDSALSRYVHGKSAELSTIYETQQKDAEIAEQKNSLLQTRVVALLVAIVLLTVFFIVYSLLRRRAAKMKAAQERIEGELQIARDIQMSMVPNIFPEREGLDMYASMTPAKEVGGDLYGYVLQGDKLYFALGDVSGKGVPASLFMAQATRLFLTLAKQGMMPGEICTNMNDALSGEDNENGMFVTFWLGLLDLQTGHLDFCNAGHNPPVIGGGDNHGDFLEMQPNAPIGLFPGLEYEGEEIESVKGRALFIYTDGLNEAENPQQEQFGDDRLLSILRNTHFDSAQQVIESLKAEVENHRKGADPNDDLTMMCLRVS